MKGLISSKIIYLSFATVVGLMFLAYLFIYSTGFYSQFLETECWKDTQGEVEKIQDYINNKGGSSELTLRSTCLDKIVFESNRPYTACRRACTELEGEKETLFSGGGDIERCMENCNKCADSKGCILVTPRIPSSWNYFKVWEMWETYQLRSQIIEAFNTIHAVSGPELQSPKEGSNALCITSTKSGEVYQITFKEGSC
jgi:hypothetical protein